MEIITSKISQQIWLLKIIAIFTVFFAHMPIPKTMMELSSCYEWIQRLFSLIGMIGVPTFFFLSGYLFKKENFLKRAKNLLIPLFFWGSITFALHSLNTGGGNISLIGYLLWILGSNCYLYFVTVLLWITIIYYFVDNDWLWITVGVISIYVYQSHLIAYPTPLTPYMNPLNFIQYFAIGHLIRKYNFWDRLENGVIAFIALLLLTILFCLKSIYVHVWYFDLISVVINLLVIIVLMYLTKSADIKLAWIAKFGKCTFVIYLCHMPIATTLNKISLPITFGFLEITRVCLVFAIISIVAYSVYSYLLKRHKYNVMSILGYRP